MTAPAVRNATLARVGVWLYLVSFLLPAIEFPGGHILPGYTCARVVFMGMFNPGNASDLPLLVFLNLANLLTIWVVVARGRTGRVPTPAILSVAFLSSLYWAVKPWWEAFPESGIPHLMVGWFAWMASIGLLLLAHTGPRPAAAER